MRLDIGYVGNVENLHLVRKELAQARIVGMDTETAGKNPLDPYQSKIRLLQVATTWKSYVLDLYSLPSGAIWDYILEPIWSNPRVVKVFQNGKFDLKFFDRLFPDKYILETVRSIADTYIMHRLCKGGNGFGKSNLETIASEVLGIDLDKTYQRYDYRNRIYKEQLLYAGLDAAILIPIYQQLSKTVCNNKLQEVCDMEFQLIPAIAQLELNGFFLDRNRWIDYAHKGKDELYTLEKNLRTFFGDINFNSPKQVAKQLSALTGMNITKTGKEVIEDLIHGYVPNVDMFGVENDYRPALELFQLFKKTVKLQDAFGMKFLEHINPVTGRLHPTFTQVDTKTGRSTTSEPNLAQIPSIGEIRAAFRAPDPSRKIITSDYSQFELRILAQLSKEQTFIDAFNNDEDIHSAMAAEMFGLESLDDVESEQRREAKIINFGVPYGMGDQGFARKLKVPLEQATQKRKRYFVTKPQLQQYFRNMERYVKEYGCVRSFSGRLRNVSDWRISDQHEFIATQASKNFPIQACLHPDSMIFERSNGYRPISELSGKDVEVWDGERFVTAQVKPSPIKEEVAVTFEGGLRVKCSPEHKFLTTNSSGKWEYRTVQEFPKTTYVKLSEAISNWSLAIKLPPFVGRAGRLGYRPLDVGLLEDRQKFGEWLGRIASDGCVLKNGEIRLLVAEHEAAILPELLEFSLLFGNAVVKKPEPSLRSISVCNQTVASQLRYVGIKERIPDFVMADRDLLIGYLRGMFDGDGTVSPDGATLCFGKKHTKESWARQVQQAFYLLGIRSRLSFCENRINVNIFKKDSELFSKIVGFINPVKQGKLSQVKPVKKDSEIYGRALKVKSVEYTGNNTQMYDVVDSETSKFMVNGVITHNSNADVMKKAIIRMFRELPRSVKLVNQVYDEAVIECDADEAEEVGKHIETIMVESGEEYIDVCPVKVSQKIGDCWEK